MTDYTEASKWLRYDPDTGIFTRRGKRAGTLYSNGRGKTYIRISINHKKYFAHRLAFLFMNKSFPVNQVDHEDGNGINNKWSNLHEATPKENSQNRRLSKNNKSGYHGIYFDECSNKYRSQIKIDGKTTHIGYFTDIFDAICSRKRFSLASS